MTLGIGMIVKDEELVMERFLNNFSDCVDQIVIVDTGSTDKTMDIIKAQKLDILKYPVSMLLTMSV